MSSQLDIFGEPHPIRARPRPPRTWQPSLFTPEQERRAEADDVREQMERWREECNGDAEHE